MSLSSWKNREKIQIFNTRVDNVSFQEAKEILQEFLLEEKLHRIYTPNTEIVMEAKKDPRLSQIVNSADLVVADGIGLVIGSKLRNHPLKERVTGYDLSMYLLEYAQKQDVSVFLLGAAPGVGEMAKKNLRELYPKLTIAGTQNGYFKGTHTGFENSEEEAAIVEKINESGAEILFVGLGFPKQELWIEANKENLRNVRVVIGNGGVIDILGGVNKRAPQVFIDWNLEWFYRLITNPSRIKRQMAIPKFLLKIMQDKNSVLEVKKETGGNNE